MRAPLPVLLISMVSLIGLSPNAARASDDVKTIDLPVKGLLWDSATHRIYATVPGSAANAGSRANTVTVINPDTGAIVSSTFVGPEPGGMALSRSGKLLFVALDGSGSIRVYDIAKHEATATISLGPGANAAGLCAAPGEPDAVAVERNARAYSPGDLGVTIYNADGTARKNTVPAGHSILYDPLTDRMYGFENEITSFGLRTLTADKDGAVQLDYVEGLIFGNVGLISVQNGLLYTNSAGVTDPITRTKVGQYPGYGYGSILAPDASTGKTYFLDGASSGTKVTAFDMVTFSPVASFLVPGARDPQPNLIRWGEQGLAFGTNSGRLFLVNSSYVGPKKKPVDLAVSAVGLPDMFAANGAATVHVTVTNLGPAAATGVVLVDKLTPNVDVLNVSGSSGQATFANGAAQLAVGSLAAKATATLTVNLKLKPFDPNQDIPLMAVTQSVFVRSNEPDLAPANNHLVQSAPLSTTGPDPAASGVDLTGAWTALSETSDGAGADLQATVNGEFEVKNIGVQTAPPTRMRFFLAADRQYDPAFVQLLQEVGVPELKAGETVKIDLKARLMKGDDAIGLYVIAVVNATNTVRETNKRNNIVPSAAIP